MANNVGASDEQSPGLVSVTINTVPTGAVIFRAGKRVGKSGVAVTLERDEKLRLTALLHGYAPATITLDGSHTAVTIMLRRAPRVEQQPDDRVSEVPLAGTSSGVLGAPTSEPTVTHSDGTTESASTAPPDNTLE